MDRGEKNNNQGECINVTAAIIEKNGKILIAKRKKGTYLENKWEFPGGKLKSNESEKECLKRELKEEFGIETEIGEFIAESDFNYGEKRVRLLGFRAKYISGQFQLNAHDEIKWISIEDFDKFDFADADIPIINKIKITKI